MRATFGWRIIALYIGLLLCKGCCDGAPVDSTPAGSSTAPQRFAMATVTSGRAAPAIFWSTLEVRVSPNGTRWTLPSYPLTANCGIPLPVNPNIAPGLGANETHYLAAAYGLNGELYFSKSRDAFRWTPAELVTTIDDGLTSESRPSVVYDREEGVWYAVLVKGVRDGSHTIGFIDLDGQTTAGVVVRTEERSNRGVAIAYTGLAGLDYVMTGNRFRGRISFFFYEVLSAAFATLVFDSTPSLSQGLDLGTVGAPWVSSTSSRIFAATNRNQQTGQLLVGVNEIWEYDVGAEEWSSLGAISPAAADHEGAAVVGLPTNMVVASPGGSQTTDLWHLATDSLGVLRVDRHQELGTRSIKTPALAYGSYERGARLENACSDGGGEILDAFVRFRSFKRIPSPDLGDFDDDEDVELNASHRGRWGVVGERFDADPNAPGIQPKVVRNATKNQSHMFNEGEPGSGWPEMRILIQPGDMVRVTLMGDDGPSEVDISYDEIAAPQGAGNLKNTTTRFENGLPAYQLDYDATVSEAQ